MTQFLLEAVRSPVGRHDWRAARLSDRALRSAWLFLFPASVSFFLVVLGVTVASLIGVFFGVYPAWKAARLNPVEALRYE